MAQLNVVRESLDVSDSDFKVASAGGDTFDNDGRTVLWIKNDSGAARNVTVVASGQCNHGFLHDRPIPIASTTTLKKSQSFPTERFGGRPTVTYDNASGLSVVAVRQEEYHG